MQAKFLDRIQKWVERSTEGKRYWAELNIYFDNHNVETMASVMVGINSELVGQSSPKHSTAVLKDECVSDVLGKLFREAEDEIAALEALNA